MNDDHVTLPDDEPDQPTEVVGTPREPTEQIPAAAEPPPPPSCAECGAELDPEQQYCLECGAPTPAAVSLRRRGGPAWMLAAGLLALGAGGGALIYSLTNDDEPVAQAPTVTTLPTDIPTLTGFTDPSTSVDVTTGDTTTVPTTTFGTSSLPTTTFPTTTVPTTTFPTTTFPTTTFPTTTFPTTTFPTTTFPTTTFPTTSTSPTTTGTVPPTFSAPSTRTTTPTTTPATGDDWTADDGYTVILASTRNRAQATAFRDKVRASGVSAGLIVSSNYSSLKPGYYAVFSGVYTTRGPAIQKAASLRSKYPGAYAQEIAA